MTRTRPAVRAAMFVLLAVASFAASGCGFWRNFSTYFNILYLAQAHLDQYEEGQTKALQPQSGGVGALSHRWLDEEYDSRTSAIRSGRQVKIQPSFAKTRSMAGGVTRAGGAVHLDSAIILGSKILAERKESKYVEDALFIVGKAQFYKGDIGGAKRKFLELLHAYPSTKYASEVQLLLARTMLASGQIDTASTALTKSLAAAEAVGDKASIAEGHRAYAEYLYAKYPDSLSAIAQELEVAESNTEEPSTAASLAFDAGAVYYLDANWPKALEAFDRAIAKSGSDDPTAGEARVSRALALRRLGRFEDSRRELAEVASRAKFSALHPVAAFELAQTNELAARAEVTNDLRTTRFTTELHPDLKERYYIVDTTFRSESQAVQSRVRFRQAEMYRGMGSYDSAAAYAMPLIGTKDFSTTAMNEFVSERMRALARFAQWKRELASLDSIQMFLKSAKPGVDLEQREELQLRSKAMQEVLGFDNRPDQVSHPTPEQEAKIAVLVERMKKDRAKTGAQAIRVGPDTTRFQDSINYRRANAYFEIGRAYENFGEMPEARQSYEQAYQVRYVIADTGRDAFRGQVLFAWAELENRQKNEVKRDSLLELLWEYYGETIYAQQARVLYAGKSRMNSPSELAYRAAYQQLQQGGLAQGKRPLSEVSTQYRREDAAPRALYAIGVAFEEMERYDSAVVYYKRVLTEYPYSAYADQLRPRLADVVSAPKPKQTARPVQTKEPLSDEEQQQQEIERVRKERERILREQERGSDSDGGADSDGEQSPLMPAPTPAEMPPPVSTDVRIPPPSQPKKK